MQPAANPPGTSADAEQSAKSQISVAEPQQTALRRQRRHQARLWRHIILFGLAGGALITLLKWTEYRYLVVEHSIEIYGGLTAGPSIPEERVGDSGFEIAQKSDQCNF